MQENRSIEDGGGVVKSAIKSFLAALRFLTIIPYYWNSENDGKYFEKAIYYFPVIGLLIGFFLSLLLTLLTFFLPHIVIVALALPLLAVVSGFLHLDGLADSFDGLFSSRPKEQILEIMRDSAVGAMGLSAVLFVMVLKFASFMAIPQNHFLVSLIIIPIAGRCSCVLAMAYHKYARKDGGLGQLFYSDSCKKAALFSVVFLFITTSIVISIAGAVFVIFTMFLLVFAFGYYCKKKIGGATGDTLGATCELTEMITALTLAVYFFNF